MKFKRTLLDRIFGNKKEKPKIVEVTPKKIDNTYDLAMQQIEDQKKEVEILSKIWRNNPIDFYDINYPIKLKQLLSQFGLENLSEQLTKLEGKYFNNSQEIKTNEISANAFPLFNKIIIHELYHDSLDGKLEKFNGFKTKYKEFYKNNSNEFPIPLEKTEKAIDSLENLSKWVSGQEVQDMDSNFENIVEYLNKQINGKLKIDAGKILNNRRGNLFLQYEKVSKENKEPEKEFNLFSNTIEKVVDSSYFLNIFLNRKALGGFQKGLNARYLNIQDLKLDKSFKKNTQENFLRISTKIYDQIYQRINSLEKQRRELGEEEYQEFSMVDEIDPFSDKNKIDPKINPFSDKNKIPFSVNQKIVALKKEIQAKYSKEPKYNYTLKNK